MTGYKFTITNSRGDTIAFNDPATYPDNYIGLQEYPAMDVDVKNQEVAREGQHGIWDFNSFYGKRTINFSGVISAFDEDAVEVIKKQLLRVISLPPIPSSTDNGYCTVKWTDATGMAWQVFAKIQAYPRFIRDLHQGSRLYFTLTMKAKNPEIESQDVTTDSGVRGWPQGSYTLPDFLPATFGIVYEKEITIANDGAVASHTVIRLYGEDGITVSNPWIYNRTTNKIFKVNIVLTGSTEWIEIDSKNGTVVDQDGNDQSALVDGASEYILLALGDNVVVYLSDESFGALSPVNTWVDTAAIFTVSHRDTMI